LLDSLGSLQRTHYCGALRVADDGRDVVLMGWVARRRNLGNLIFIDLRDRAGIAQVVFNRDTSPDSHVKAEQLRSEYVVAVEGRVVRRAKANPELATGKVEVVATRLHILNTAKTPPFTIEDEITATEETRLRYRYLDLRRPRPARLMELRHRVIFEIRKAMDELGFYEIETPMLTRSTPEGARDYLVPSRVHPGQFYALPQSPQIFKQILMISGVDRYFQIVRCFRDEDLRADRQPEFTQLDLEISFPTQDAVFGVIERVMQRACAVVGVNVNTPFPRMKHKEALARYGTDKPDTRFGLELTNLTLPFGQQVIGGAVVPPVWGFVVRGGARYSRGQLDELKAFVQTRGAKTLYHAKITDSGIQSPLEKMIGKSGLQQLQLRAAAVPGDLILAAPSPEGGPGQWPHEVPSTALADLRLQIARTERLILDNQWAFLWVTDFPLFEWSGAENAWVTAQHPFTGIFEEDLDKLEDTSDAARASIRSKGYDLVLNGTELGSGSIRIHQQGVQVRVFRALGLTDEQARQRFGFFLDALTYGTPPHGGIALGLDRVVALLAGEKSIREVIAFPKTTAAQDLMADAPSSVETNQLDELGIALKREVGKAGN